MDSPSVLVVDDEPEIIEVVCAYLKREGFSVVACGSVKTAMDAILAQRPDVMILDITLPDGSGLDILRRSANHEHRIPAIMLTARSDETDRIVGLELGADDYVTKPFLVREVVARVRALLRRLAEASASSAKRSTNRVITIDKLEIDPEFHEVRIAGNAVDLTATEFKILHVLAENPGEVFTRSHLLDLLGDKGEIFERTLDRHINNLRKKVEPDLNKPYYVLTVYGIGYKMRR